MKKTRTFGVFHGVVIVVLLFFAVYLCMNIGIAASPWPTDSQWNIITGNGSPLIDREARASCTDPTNGGANPSQENDIGSQAKCSNSPRYNPGLVDAQFGNGLQPSATVLNTFSAANYYKDASNNSSGCNNLADDTFFFRTRIAADPMQTNVNNGFKNSFWWATLDVNADGIIDFYVRVDGNGNKASETLTVIHEESTGASDPIDNDPTGEPVIVTYTNPINLGLARAVATPDNATVGDQAAYFIDWQIPVTDFKSSTNAQILCYGNNLVLTNYSTSDANQPLAPFQKDFIQAAGTVSDVITLDNPDYTLTKTATDVNGGTLYPGDQVEYTVTATNIGSNLSNFRIVDSIPVGAAYVAGSMKATLGNTTYNLSDASDVEATCPSSMHCMADYNVSNAGAVSFFNDWLYSTGSVSPLYDTITFKFRVTFAAQGEYSNQAIGKVRELSDKLSDDPSVGGTSDSTSVTVSAPLSPGSTDLAITKTDGVTQILSGSSVTYNIVVTNNGPNVVTGAMVNDNFAGSLSNINWICTASAGSTCAASGTGNISDASVSLLVGGTATYSVTADTDPFATGTLVNTATVALPVGMVDSVSDNNSATDTDNYTPTDFGDAPDPSYPTLVVNNGARHAIVSGKYLGSSVDAEADGLQSATATGDDINNLDDEDGVNFTTSLIKGNTADLNVIAGSAGKLDAWIDFDANGSWGDAEDKVFASQNLSAGTNALSVPIPLGATAGSTYARFRFSTSGGLSYNGAASDGEVEDYQLTILNQPDLSTSVLADDDVDNLVSSLQTVLYTLTISNTGGSIGTGISVDDILDANMENLVITGFSNCGVPTNTSIANPSEIHLTNLSIAPFNSCIVTFTARVKAGTPGGVNIDNTAIVSASAQGGVGANPSSDTLAVPTLPDLSTSTKIDDDADNDVSNGQTIAYTITINNTGNGTGTGITVDDILDPNLENLVVGSVVDCGSPVDTSTPTELHVSSVAVDVGVPCVINYFASVLPSAPGSSVIMNTVNISAATEGGVGAVKSSDNLVVNGTIDFSTSSKIDTTPLSIVFPGDTITYEISINNTGNTDATGVVVADTIDANLGVPTNFGFTDCGSPIDDFSSPTLTLSNIKVAAFSACRIIYDATVNSPITNDNPESLVVNNFATISPANGSGTLTSGPLSLDVAPDLSTSTKIDDDVDNNVVPGQTITYTLLLNNTGDGTGTNVTVDDAVDSHFGNLRILSISNCGASYNTTGTINEPPKLNIIGLKVDPGVPCSIEYIVDVDAGLVEGTTMTNSANVLAAAEGGLGATANSNSLIVASVPFLTVAKTANATDNIVTPGQTVTYTITVGNDGNGAATGISATDTIDPNLSVPTNFNYSNCGSLANANFVDPVITFSDLSAAVPLDCVMSYTVMVNPAAANATLINNSVDVGAAIEGSNDPDVGSATTLTVNAPVVTSSSGNEKPVVNGGGRPTSYEFERSSIPVAKTEKPQAVTSCLTYNPSRNLVFNDLDEEESMAFQKAAEVLRDTYITKSNDYIISGYQSFTKDIGARTIGLGQNITKFQWAKILMLSHCLPIRNALSLKDKTVHGNALPHFVDLPLEHNKDKVHNWYVDTIYSAAYYEIIGGSASDRVNADSNITVSEGVKMAIQTVESLKGKPSRTANAKVNPRIDRAKWYFAYYSKAAGENIFNDLIQSPDRAESLLVRNEAFYNLLDAMLRDDLYSQEDVSDIKDYFKKTFVGGKKQAIIIGEKVLGASNQEHLLLAKIARYEQTLAQERQATAIYVGASLLLMVVAFYIGKQTKKSKRK